MLRLVQKADRGRSFTRKREGRGGEKEEWALESGVEESESARMKGGVELE